MDCFNAMSVSTAICGLTISSVLFGVEADDEKAHMSDENVTHVTAFALPASSFLREETHAALRKSRLQWAEYTEELAEACPALDKAALQHIPDIRKCIAEVFYTSDVYVDLRARYAVDVASTTINGVYVEVFTPSDGILKSNRERVLVNLHGGAFKYGSRTISHLESVPIAAVGRIKVISIDYRMAPEYTFPAATKDVTAVYQALLNDYDPETIGIFGCSAGGVLAGQSIAWFQDTDLPLPGAIGMFFGAVNEWSGDSDNINHRLYGLQPGEVASYDYYSDMDSQDPLAYPGSSEMTLRGFPPSLLITSTRDMALSNVVVTHAQLRKLDREAELYVWEGLEHAFHYYPGLPESQHVYDVIVGFFDRRLR